MDTRGLGAVPLFAALKKSELQVVGRIADEVDVPEGHVLTRQGDVGREFFVIETGTAEVTRGEDHVADLGPGDFFGEMALIEDQARTATVTATTPVRSIVLTAAAFRSLRHTAPSVYATVKDEIHKRRAVTA